MKISDFYEFPVGSRFYTVKIVNETKVEIQHIFTETHPFELTLGQVVVLVCTTSLQSLVTNRQVWTVHFSARSLKFRFSAFRAQPGIGGIEACIGSEIRDLM